MNSSPVAMRDVARNAGVSITTVSHVINNTRPVAEATRARVLREINQLDYYQNKSARLLVRGRSDLFGLVISDIENPFFPELIKSFEDAAAQHGLDVLLCATNYDRQQAEKAFRRMLENRVQAVAIMTSQFDDDLAKQLAEKDIPLVRLGARSSQQNCKAIAVDYRKGVSSALEYLKSLGHRKFAIATGPQGQVSAVDYQRALLTSLNKSGLNPLAVVEGDHTPETGARIATSLLSVSNRPTAIFCGNDRMAIGALGAVVELGLRVPEDVSIIGSDDLWMSRYCHPPLTTVRIPRKTLGSMAFDVLFDMHVNRKEQAVVRKRVLETELVIRRSTGIAPSASNQLEVNRR